MSDKQQPHLDYIDALRGIAALLVMFFHGRQALWIGFSEFRLRHPHFDVESILPSAFLPFRIGFWGVQLFFVISGYCIHLHAAEKKNTFRTLSWKSFYLRRFFRLYPAYFAAIVFTLICTVIIGTPIEWGSVKGNLIFLQGWLTSPLNYNDPLWSISVEVLLYLLYPLLFLMKEFWGPSIMLIIIACIGILTNVLWLMGITFALSLVFSAWMPWAVGLWIAEKERKNELSIWRPKLQFVFVAMSLSAAVYLHLRRPDRFGQEPFLAYAFGFLIYYGFCKGSGNWRAKTVASKLIVFLGLISYSLYLFHRPTQFLLRSLYENHIGQVPENLGLFALGMGLSIFIAWASYLLIELKFIKVGQLLAKKS